MCLFWLRRCASLESELQLLRNLLLKLTMTLHDTSFVFFIYQTWVKRQIAEAEQTFQRVIAGKAHANLVTLITASFYLGLPSSRSFLSDYLR